MLQHVVIYTVIHDVSVSAEYLQEYGSSYTRMTEYSQEYGSSYTRMTEYWWKDPDTRTTASFKVRVSDQINRQNTLNFLYIQMYVVLYTVYYNVLYCTVL